MRHEKCLYTPMMFVSECAWRVNWVLCAALCLMPLVVSTLLVSTLVIILYYYYINHHSFRYHHQSHPNSIIIINRLENRTIPT